MEHDVLHGLVKRQARVYNDLVDKIIELVRQQGSIQLVEAIEGLRNTYGLNDFAKIPPSEKDKTFRVRPMMYEDELAKEVVRFLIAHRGRRFKSRDILANIDGRTNEYIWYKARAKLLEAKQIRNEERLYWID